MAGRLGAVIWVGVGCWSFTRFRAGGSIPKRLRGDFEWGGGPVRSRLRFPKRQREARSPKPNAPRSCERSYRNNRLPSTGYCHLHQARPHRHLPFRHWSFAISPSVIRHSSFCIPPSSPRLPLPTRTLSSRCSLTPFPFRVRRALQHQE